MCVCDCRYSERTQLLDSSGVRGKKACELPEMDTEN